MGKPTIYLDYAAATPVDPRVFEAMHPYFSGEYGNPSSLYTLAQRARKAVDESRATIAKILNAKSREIIFTSGGTESDNLAILGLTKAYAKNGRHIIATTIEHHAVLRPLELLEEEEFEVTYVPCDTRGLINPTDIEAAIRPDTILISTIYANNEIGTVQEVADIGRIVAKAKGTRPYPLFHTDACQAPGFLPLNVQELGIDAMTLNAGKIYGPKGVGVLYLRTGTLLAPQIRGGGQEYRLRSGTENVPGIVGMAKALELAALEGPAESARLQHLRDRLIAGILEKIPRSHLNGDREKRLPSNVNISFEHVDADTLLIRLDLAGIAASSGSACTSGVRGPSHVLMGIGRTKALAAGSLRLTLGKSTTDAEVQTVLDLLPGIIADLRTLSQKSRTSSTINV